MRVVEPQLAQRVTARPHVTVVLDRVALVLAAALLAFHAGMLWRFAVDWPLHDDLTQILAVPGYMVQMATVREQLAFLFALSPEHRIAVLRAIGWAGGLTTGLDFKLLIAIGNAMGIATVACVAAGYPARWRAGAALLGVLLCTSVTHYATQYHATGALQHFGVLFWSLAALIALDRGSRALAIVLALVAACTSANGLLAFPAAAVLMELRHRRGEAVGWAVAGIVVIVGYFAGSAGGSGRSLVPLLGNPLALASSVLATLGSIGQTIGASHVFGAAIALAWTGIVASGAWRRVPPLAVAFTAFAAMSCALIAAGRATPDVDLVTLPRYRIYSALALFATVCSVAWVVGDAARWRVLAPAVIVATMLYASAWPAMMPSLIDLNAKQLAFRDHFGADDSSHYDGFEQQWGDFTLRRARDLGVYRGMRKAAPPLRLAEASAPASEGSASKLLYAKVFPGSRAFSVFGQFDGRHRDVSLLLESGSRVLRTSLTIVTYPGARFRPHTAFRGTIDVTGVPPGTYRLGFSDGADGVHWTQDEVEVR